MADTPDHKTQPPAARPGGEPAAGATADRLKVFISYSRDDIDFADELDLALRDRGFSPIIDRHGIDAGEQWRKRLGDLIFSCDTVVFILTDSSAASDTCAWEAREAARLDKRILVVTLDNITAAAPPRELAEINWIACWRDPDISGSSWTQGLIQLDNALRTDLAWLRQRTRLEEQATLWQNRTNNMTNSGDHAAVSSMLLRGNVLTEALDWTARKPASATIPDAIARFLHASETHEADLKAEAEANLQQREQAIEASKRASRRLRWTAIAGLILAAALLGWTGWVSSDVSRMASNVIAREARAANVGEFYEAAALLALHARPAANEGPVEAIRFARTGHSEAVAQLRRANADALLARVFTGHDSAVRSAVFSSDNDRILTASYDGTARLWDGQTGTLIYPLEGHGGQVYTAVFSGDGDRILTASSDGTARLWNARTGTLIHTLEGHGDQVYTAVFSSDNDRILTASLDGTARLWDAQTAAPIHALEGHGDPILSAGFSSGGDRILTASSDRTARLWDAQTGALVHRLEGHHGLVQTAVFSSGDDRILTASYDGTARLWDAQTGTPIHALEGHGDLVNTAVFSSDGDRILTASSDGTARLWDAETGTLIHPLEGHGGTVNTAVFSSDGDRILTASRDGTARLWDAETGTLIHPLEGHGGPVYTAVFSSGDDRILTASYDGTARLWEAQTGTLIHPLEGHGGPVNSAVFSSGGDRILTASSDRTARLWDAQTGTPIHALARHGALVDSAVFSGGDDRILTASYDGIARLWEVPEAALLAPRDLVERACERLHDIRAPLFFRRAELAEYPVIRDEPDNPDTGDLLSPCRGILTDEQIAENVAIWGTKPSEPEPTRDAEPDAEAEPAAAE